MKQVYCSNCGQPLEIKRKALTKYNMIIDIVPPHACSEEPRNLSELGIKLHPITVDMLYKEERKFDQKLIELERDTPKPTDPGDRRPKESIKATTLAPKSVLDIIQQSKITEEPIQPKADDPYTEPE
jgi:hypothetical protein